MVGSKSEMCVRMTRAVVDIVKPLPLKIGYFLKSILIILYVDLVLRYKLFLMGIICGTKLLQHGLLCISVSARCDSGVLFFP